MGEEWKKKRKIEPKEMWKMREAGYNNEVIASKAGIGPGSIDREILQYEAQLASEEYHDGAKNKKIRDYTPEEKDEFMQNFRKNYRRPYPVKRSVPKQVIRDLITVPCGLEDEEIIQLAKDCNFPTEGLQEVITKCRAEVKRKKEEKEKQSGERNSEETNQIVENLQRLCKWKKEGFKTADANIKGYIELLKTMGLRNSDIKNVSQRAGLRIRDIEGYLRDVEGYLRDVENSSTEQTSRSSKKTDHLDR